MNAVIKPDKSTGATFLNGEHYLVDAFGNLLKLKESVDFPIFIQNRDYVNRGFFVFHFGSSIGTHQIEIRRKDNDKKVFPVVVICSPTGRSDKCYYYAPEYNLNRFEESQGFIASNHFNAKTSSISFNGIFYLMSVRLGERWIKLSTTLALNRIRKSEEMEKGWRKSEIKLPPEFRDLDPVHVIPIIDVKKLLLILVTRSIVLSNTLYSLLLEAEGKFLTLGSEWIGSLVRYEEKSVCFSRLFSRDDEFYTDQFGNNNDECEYFGNGIVFDENIYIQNFVFDATFEIQFNFEVIELDFVQQKAERKIHVTSNPFFAFHDDVFPGFSKNSASQSRFFETAKSIFPPYPKSIIPNHHFSSLEEFKHISTFVLKLDGEESFQFEINFQVRKKH